MGNILQLFRAAPTQDEFEALLKPHVETLYKLAWRFTSNQSDAEDLVQGFLLKLYNQQDKLAEVEVLKPWLARSIYNYFVSDYRKHKRDPLKHSEELTDFDSVVDEQDPYRQQETLSQSELWMKLLEELPKEQRSIVLMHDIEGYALNEVAEIIGIPLGTVKSRLCRAREKLKTFLSMEPWKDLLRDRQ